MRDSFHSCVSLFSLAGFLVKSLDKIRQLHHQLNMESLEVSKPSGPRKKVGICGNVYPSIFSEPFLTTPIS